MSSEKGPKPDKQAKNRHRTVTSWKPGESGNLRGRPRAGSSLGEVWRNYLDAPAGLKDGRSRKERIAARLYNLVIRGGSVPAAKLLVEQVANAELAERLAALEERVQELGLAKGRTG